MPSPYLPSSHSFNSASMIAAQTPNSAPTSPQQSPTGSRQYLPPPPPVKVRVAPSMTNAPPTAPPHPHHGLDTRRGSVMPPPIPLRITSLPTPPPIPPALLMRQNSLGSMYSAYLKQHGLMTEMPPLPPVPVTHNINYNQSSRSSPPPITITTRSSAASVSSPSSQPPPLPPIPIPSSPAPFSPTISSPAQSPTSAGGIFFPSSSTLREHSPSVDSVVPDGRRGSVLPPPIPITALQNVNKNEVKRTRPPPIQATTSLPVTASSPLTSHPSPSLTVQIKDSREEKINPQPIINSASSVLSPTFTHTHKTHPPFNDHKCDRLDPKAFASHLHHVSDVVSNQCLSGLTTSKRVRSFLHSYALLQQRHANEIEKLIHYEVGKLGANASDDRMHAFNMIYQNLLMKIGVEGVQTSTLSNDLNTQCIETIDKLINVSNQMSKNHQEEAKKHQVAMDKANINIAKARENARQALAKNDTRKALKSCEIYEKVIEQSNEIYSQHQVLELPKLLSEMQGLEEMRLQTLAATLKNFAVLTLNHSQSVKSLHQDIKLLTESFNVNHDLKLFIAEAIHENGPPLEPQPFSYDITVTTEELKEEIENETQATKHNNNNNNSNNNNITSNSHFFVTSHNHSTPHSSRPPALFFDSLSRVMEYERNSLKLIPDPNFPNEIPIILPTLISAIRRHHGLDSEGIFRLSVSSEELYSLRKRMESGNYSVDQNNPHLYAALLKAWLRDLSEPVIPFSLYEQCIEIGKMDFFSLINNDDGRQSLTIIFSSMPELNQRVLKYLLEFLSELSSLAHVEHNRMTVQNLAIVFAPGLIRSEDADPVIMLRDSKYACNAVAAFIELTRANNNNITNNNKNTSNNPNIRTLNVGNNLNEDQIRKSSISTPPPIPSEYHRQQQPAKLERSQSASDIDTNDNNNNNNNNNNNATNTNININHIDDSQRVFIHGLNRNTSSSSSFDSSLSNNYNHNNQHPNHVHTPSQHSHVSLADQLPPHWTSSYDPSTQQTYYWNTITRETSWDFPTH